MHQALLQIYGTKSADLLAVSGLADRLDVPAAFASRLISRLERLGLVKRETSSQDRRVTHVSMTDAGIDQLKKIDDSVHHHVAHFQHQLSETQRMAALSIFAFYVGIDPTSRGLRKIGTENNDRDGVRPLGRINRGAVKVCLTFG